MRKMVIVSRIIFLASSPLLQQLLSSGTGSEARRSMEYTVKGVKMPEVGMCNAYTWI